MTTEPTAKHQEEARDVVEGVFGKRGSSPIYATAGRLFDELQSKFAERLSVRDTEIERLRGWQEGLAATTVAWSEQRLADTVTRDTQIREVLEGLRDDDCFDACFLRWMKRYEDSDGFEHSPTCLAARGLWEKVQPTKENL